MHILKSYINFVFKIYFIIIIDGWKIVVSVYYLQTISCIFYIYIYNIIIFSPNIWFVHSSTICTRTTVLNYGKSYQISLLFAYDLMVFHFKTILLYFYIIWQIAWIIYPWWVTDWRSIGQISFQKLSKTGRIVVGIEISRDQQVSFPRNMGFADSFEMSVGLPVAQARPSSGLV